ncbi:MAG: Panacea domain-containing protein [Microthrixaceae bacterium]
MDIEYDEAKFTELLVHVAGRLGNDRAGGATKLNKVLYFAEFAHVRRHGRPITGAEYFRLDQGPAPRRLKPVRQRLLDSGDAELVVEDFLGYSLQRLVPLRAPDLSRFDRLELQTIDDVLGDLASLTAKQVSDISHEDPAWRHTDDLQTIPYELALVAKEQVVTAAGADLAAETARRYGMTIVGA